MYHSIVFVTDGDEKFQVDESPTGRLSVEVRPKKGGLLGIVLEIDQALQLRDALTEHLQAPAELSEDPKSYDDDVPF